MKRLHSASSSLVPTMSTFVRKGSLRIVDASMIPPLLDVLRTGSEAFGTDSQSQRRTARRGMFTEWSSPHVLIVWL